MLPQPTISSTMRPLEYNGTPAGILMNHSIARAFLGLPLAGLALLADVRNCGCDTSRPESLEARECGLCREAEKQPAGIGIFFLKDINPRKANRWLALPRAHKHNLLEMTREERTALWEAAIAKGKELWGDGWGLAFNGNLVRTQCHAHLHIGKFLPAVENDRNLRVVKLAADIPAPEDDSGMWVHPVDGKLHVHLGEQICETTLLR